MSTFLTLTPAELQELTGKRRADAQRRALDRMGLRYAVRPDGRPTVLRSHVEEKLGTPRPLAGREPRLHL